MGANELAVVGLVGSSVGAALGAPLIWAGRDGRTEVRVLGAATLTVAALAGLISARLGGWLPGSAAVGHAVNGLGLVAFPLAVAYVRLATGATRRLSWLALVPLAGYVMVSLARLSATGRSDVPFAWLLPAVLTFTGAAAVAAWRGRTTDSTLVPPAWVVGFMALVNVAQIARMDLGHVPAVRAVVPLVMVAGFVAMVAFVVWRQVRSDMAAAIAVDAPVAPVAFDVVAVPVPRYDRSTLDEAAATALLARVTEALERDRLFARPDLTLAMLARAADSTPHLVSEALNRFGHTPFRDLVSRRRVDDVKAQLADPASARYTIEGIGAAAGFRSRSAMYEAFRRWEGTTPTRPGTRA